MYTCSLQGCKSAWGTSDDIFHHVTKPKHFKNFFRRLNPDDARVAGLSGADILAEVYQQLLYILQSELAQETAGLRKMLTKNVVCWNLYSVDTP